MKDLVDDLIKLKKQATAAKEENNRLQGRLEQLLEELSVFNLSSIEDAEQHLTALNVEIIAMEDEFEALQNELIEMLNVGKSKTSNRTRKI
jgi:polyhydroxyalkanoate synthesis regulator phasin